MRTQAERWKLAATWFNQEIDNLLAESGGTLGAHLDPETQSLLIRNILAEHMREFSLDQGLMEELCKVCLRAGISEPLIIATIEAFVREYGPKPEDVRNN
jgi:hypothetical protein